MSAPKRFFVDKISEEVALSGEEFRHAKNVLRLSEGDEVTLLDGSGAEYAAIVARTEKNGMLLHVTGKSEGGNEPMANVLLLIGALKGDKTELVVQKATELGVNKIGVFSSRYCAAYMNENKLERLNRVSREAAKQCRRSVAPEVVYYGTLEEALHSADGYSSKLFACEFLKPGGGQTELCGGSCAIVVGSEGGFTQEEFERAQAAGFTGISLGKRILRAETAAIAITAIVMSRLGELQ